MGNFRRVIDGVLIEMAETADHVFDVLGDGVPLVVLTHTPDDGKEHGRWFCVCGENSGKRNPMLSHVVAKHASASPLVTADKGLTFEAMNTYLRLTGKHADPTYDASMRHLYGSSW